MGLRARNNVAMFESLLFALVFKWDFQEFVKNVRSDAFGWRKCDVGGPLVIKWEVGRGKRTLNNEQCCTIFSPMT